MVKLLRVHIYAVASPGPVAAESELLSVFSFIKIVLRGSEKW